MPKNPTLPKGATINRPLILKNRIQAYAWGSHSAIQKLLGEPATKEPWAELWMGAHPKAPSRINVSDRWISLDRLIKTFPHEILGESVAKRFSDTLPYLFKVLAADQPLSIQAHPNLKQAKEGFERENSLKIPMDAPNRNYRDMNHKPECICALTRFTALKGFRRITGMLARLKSLCPLGLADELHLLEKQGDLGLKNFFHRLLTLPETKKQELVAEAVVHAEKNIDHDDIFKWIMRLYQKYPADIGILSPAILNLITLEPGEALFLPAGELHAYLYGLGIELMANSDNVLRGGLTPKHIDPPELLTVLNFTETDIDTLLPEDTVPGEKRYPVLAEEFFLSVITLKPGVTCVAPEKHSADILLCVSGEGSVTCSRNNHPVPLKRGTSILVPAAAGGYHMTGDAIIYKAGVPL